MNRDDDDHNNTAISADDFADDFTSVLPYNMPDERITTQAGIKERPAMNKAEPASNTQAKKPNVLLWAVGAVLVIGAAGAGTTMWVKSHQKKPYTSAIAPETEPVPAPKLPEVQSAQAAQSVASASAPSTVQPLASAAATVAPEVAAKPAVEQAELLRRVSRIESILETLFDALRSRGYIKAAKNAEDWSEFSAGDMNPYPPEKPSTPVVPVVRRVVKVAPALVTQVAPVATTPVAAPVAPKQSQVLAIDMWDGRPSVVLGSGVPEDKRVVVQQVGETRNGVTLKSVDVHNQRAVFTVGGRDLTYDVATGN